MSPTIAPQDYSSRYEATQSFSPTFNAFSRRLANDLIARYDLRDKDVIEIGCGQGEFLVELCELGGNRGVGFDPAYDAERGLKADPEQIRFIADYYSERYTDYQADFVCCKMTLEHIDQTADFVSMVRRSIADRTDTIVFFQIPNATRVLRDLAFWDIYYEHCSYFTPGSLAYLFRRSGFDVLDVRTDYDDQYLMIEAKPACDPALVTADDAALAETRRDVEYFRTRIPAKLREWQTTVRDLHQQGQRIVIWGGGSKGVAFLTTLGFYDEIEYAVDINPRKHSMFMAGTGQETVGPDFLREYQPDTVIVMNPIYCDEIQRDLDRLGVSARLLPL